jgi:hypothetical protein
VSAMAQHGTAKRPSLNADWSRSCVICGVCPLAKGHRTAPEIQAWRPIVTVEPTLVDFYNQLIVTVEPTFCRRPKAGV